MRPLTEAWKEVVTRRGRFSCRPSYQNHAGSAEFLTNTHGSARFGTDYQAGTKVSPKRSFSGSSEAWYRARFGTGRSRVQTRLPDHLHPRDRGRTTATKPRAELIPGPPDKTPSPPGETSIAGQKNGPFKSIEERPDILASMRFLARIDENADRQTRAAVSLGPRQHSGNLTASHSWWAQWWAHGSVVIQGTKSVHRIGSSPHAARSFKCAQGL